MEVLKLLPTTNGHGWLRVVMVGEFDLSGVDHFREVVDPAIASGESRQIEFDLERLTFIDSSGLHALVEADRAMRAQGGTVNVVGVGPPVLKVFELTGLDRLLTIVGRTPSMRAAA
jgi:anti-anti-sigma factor